MRGVLTVYHELSRSMEAPKKKARGGKYCCAGAPNDTSCKNSTYTPGISMHVFPKNEKQRRQWVQFVRRHRAGFTPTSASALCSVHFKPTDFVRRIDIDVGSSSSSMTSQRRLEVGAIPTIDTAGFAPQEVPSERDRRRARKVGAQLRPGGNVLVLFTAL